MPSTFWQNRICERQCCQNRHTGLKFSSKRENSALSMKIVQNVLFRSCTARFGKSHFWRSKLSKSSNWPEIVLKTGKQCTLHENCTKRSFQIMRSTFWPTRICERQSGENRHTGLKFSSKRENSALSMKIVQNALFTIMRSKFWQIAFLRVKVLKIVTLAWNSLQKGKTVRFSWKLYKTLFSDHAQHVLPKSHFWGSKFWKSLHLSEILFKTRKQCAFHENCTKRSFQVLRSTYWPNRICERQSSQNRHTGLKFSLKRENSAFSMKIVQNALFTSCGARLGQIAFLKVKVVKIVELAWICPQNGKRVHFPWKLYKTLFSDHAQHVLAKSHSSASKWWKWSHWPQIFSKKGKQCAFHKNCTKRSFQIMRSTFCPNRIFERQSSQNRHTGLKFSLKRENSAFSLKIVQNALFTSCGARFGQIAFLKLKVVKIVTLARNCPQNGKTVRLSWEL